MPSSPAATSSSATRCRSAISTSEATPTAAAVLEDLLGARLVLVTGKGGTGKTTFAAALAALAAVRGRRTVLCEVDNQRPSMTSIFARRPRFQPRTVRPGLDLCNLAWNPSLEAFLRRTVPASRVVSVILRNQLVQRFLDFTPGSREMVTLSAIGQLTDDYDLVVVDMPASGHAFSLLDITRSALGLFRTGPVRERARELAALIAAPTSRLAMVALPEEMVVNETLETWQRMEHMFGEPPALFLNRSTLPSLTDDERALIASLGAVDLPPPAAEFVRAGRWEDALEQATAISKERLSAELQAPVLVPPAQAGSSPREVVESVSVHLGRSVGVTRRELAWT